MAKQTEGIQDKSYLCRQNTSEVVKHNTLMNGITSTRGEAFGMVQEDVLTLRGDGTFTLVKELKSTKRDPMLKDPVNVRYTFRGTYRGEGNRVELSEAASGFGMVDWGSVSQFLDTGDGEYDSADSPGILSLYPTAFFIENCKNVPMEVFVNEEEGTFTFEEFEAVILSKEEAGIIQVKKQMLAAGAGLMKEPLVENISDYVLKEKFEECGMKVGTCINPDYLKEPYVSILKAQFSSVTLENHLKPEHVLDQMASRENGRLTVTFSRETVELLEWCRKNCMPVRGHTLIWYMGTPEWIFHEGFDTDAACVSREEMIKRMEDFISGYFTALRQGGWTDIIYCMDVVNEAVVAPAKMRKCQWQEIIGDDYVWYAYHFARQYAPANIRLCYNDFDLETKTDKVIELVNSLKEDNGSKLVDIVGQQGHYGAYSNTDTLMEALEKIGQETGCELQITELDVAVSRNGTDEELKLQGRFYYHFIQQVLELRRQGINITGVTLWGFADELSWMPSGFLHLYDRNMVAKYAYFGMCGAKEKAGFDVQKTELPAAGGSNQRFVVSGKESLYIQLQEDGSFVDTTTGVEITGGYVYDGSSTYMLTPKSGGYINLTVMQDCHMAERTEAAGNRIELHIK